MQEAKLGELNHLSTPGKEIKRDSESSGERNWKSLNRPARAGVAGPSARSNAAELVRKLNYSGKVLGKPDREGEIPVREMVWTPQGGT